MTLTGVNPGCAFAPGKATGWGPGACVPAPGFKYVQLAAPESRLCLWHSRIFPVLSCLCVDRVFSASLPSLPLCPRSPTFLHLSGPATSPLPPPPFPFSLPTSHALQERAGGSLVPALGPPSGEGKAVHPQLSLDWEAGSVWKPGAQPASPQSTACGECKASSFLRNLLIKPTTATPAFPGNLVKP